MTKMYIIVSNKDPDISGVISRVTIVIINTY